MPKNIELQVTSAITPDEVNNLLQKIYDLAGCPSCGFLGYDFTIRVLPAELEKAKLREMEKFDSVLDARITESRIGVGSLNF